MVIIYMDVNCLYLIKKNSDIQSLSNLQKIQQIIEERHILAQLLLKRLMMQNTDECVAETYS